MDRALLRSNEARVDSSILSLCYKSNINCVEIQAWIKYMLVMQINIKLILQFNMNNYEKSADDKLAYDNISLDNTLSIH